MPYKHISITKCIDYCSSQILVIEFNIKDFIRALSQVAIYKLIHFTLLFLLLVYSDVFVHSKHNIGRNNS